MKPTTKISILFLFLLVNIVFFTIIRRNFPSVYQLIASSEFLDATFILGGFLAAVILSSSNLYIVYRELRKAV